MDNVKLDIKAMLLGDPIRLRYVKRFSTCHVTHSESVAEHSYYVGLYAMFIADWLIAASDDYVSVSFELLMKKCLLHDLDEARTGDFYRPFKYSEPGLAHSIVYAARKQFASIINWVFPSHIKLYTYIWDDAKDCSTEGCIVELADYLSVLAYMLQEIHVSNITMKEHWLTMKEYAANFDTARFGMFREIIAQALVLLNEGFASRGVDSLNP